MTQHAKLRLRRVGAVQVPLPAYQTEGSAGLDLCAALPETGRLAPGERRLIPTGLGFEIPEGYEGQVRPRSGLALKHGIGIVNAPGTIDSDFRGEVGIVLINHGQEPFAVEPLSRIAQIVVARVEQVAIEEAETLTETSRGAGGYGSTGR
jgi:dUTP pyrophosphatase